MKIIFLCFVFLASMEYSHAATKTKCQVVAALRAEGVPDSDIRNWLCLVLHESGYQYDVIHNIINNNKKSCSSDYGIYQLNDNLRCGRTTTSYSTCELISKHGCNVPCNSLLDSDISDDTACAVKIKNCFCFCKWYGWVKNCQDVSGSEFDFSSC